MKNVWPKTAQNPYGEILEVLGNNGGNDSEMISILVNQGLDYKFPPEVLSEAEKIHLELDQKEVKSRRDFRDITTLTIDPFDAKDFDDAISFQKLENGHFEIGVHIADVSHYVQPESPMDVEALKRSNSVYIVDRVKDMIISGGENIYSAEVENAIYQLDGVIECAVIGIPNAEWGEAVHAIVRKDPSSTITDGDVILHSKKLIAGFKCPKSVSFREDPMPLSGAGKILKTTLREPFWEGHKKQVS